MPRRKRKRPSGQGTVWERGGNWWVQWRENGRRRSAKFDTRDTAERVLARIVGDLAARRGGLEVDRSGGQPIAELVEPWVERRRGTHRSAVDDASRFKVHLTPFFGRMRPEQVTPAEIRRFVEQTLLKLSSTTVGHCVRLLSTFFSDLIERELATSNPVRSLPRATRRLFRNARDPKDTPYLERTEDIRAVFLKLPEPFNVAFAVGALAGLRTAEILGLEWAHVDVDARRIMVRQQVRNGRLTGLKDDESRVVPIGDSLAPVLRAWKVRSGGKGLLFVPTKKAKHAARFIDAETLGRHLRTALEKAKLPSLTWYQATRHAFASQFVIGGGSLEKLRLILGHAVITTTDRYAHLSAAHFGARELSVVSVDLSARKGKVVALGNSVATRAPRRSKARKEKTANSS